MAAIYRRGEQADPEQANPGQADPQDEVEEVVVVVVPPPRVGFWRRLVVQLTGPWRLYCAEHRIPVAGVLVGATATAVTTAGVLVYAPAPGSHYFGVGVFGTSVLAVGCLILYCWSRSPPFLATEHGEPILAPGPDDGGPAAGGQPLTEEEVGSVWMSDRRFIVDPEGGMVEL